MKNIQTIAVLEADLEVTPIGTRSRLAMDLRGITILRATVERVRRATRIERVIVACPAGQRGQVERLVDGTGADVVGVEADPPPWRGLIRSARKWSLDGWRGGIGGSTVFDEFTDCRVLESLLHANAADAVLSVPPAAPFFDPSTADAMVRKMESDEQDSRLVFTQMPPGIAGILLKSDLVREMAEKRIPIGWLFSYKPDAPRKDLIFESCCLTSPIELRHASGRLILDTQRAVETAAALLTECDAADSIAIGRWLQARDADFVWDVPREIEIELTTEDPYPATLLRPRGACVDRRGPMNPAVVASIARELECFDDSLLVLGGFGDPLLHPDLRAILSAVRPRDGSRPGVYGLAVRTHGADLTDGVIDLLMEFGVDVLEIMLDAWTPELYGRLHGGGDASRADLSRVLASIDRLERARAAQSSVRPVIVPSMTKAKDNVHELDEFHDGWLRRLGTVCIAGFSHYARQLEDRSVMSMTPPSRFACRRLRSRCMVLADGRMTMCGMDFQGRFAVGSVGPEVDENQSDRRLAGHWKSGTLANVRQTHGRGLFDATSLCASCDDWHGP